jgi:hypothetical protein
MPTRTAPGDRDLGRKWRRQDLVEGRGAGREPSGVVDEGKNLCAQWEGEHAVAIADRQQCLAHETLLERLETGRWELGDDLALGELPQPVVGDDGKVGLDFTARRLATQQLVSESLRAHDPEVHTYRPELLRDANEFLVESLGAGASPCGCNREIDRTCGAVPAANCGKQCDATEPA